MFKDKVIAITGAAGGIGRAIAEKMLARGAKVAISDIDFNTAQSTAAEIGAHAFLCDVGVEADIRKFIDGVNSSLGPIDIFVSNAGIGLPDLPGNHAAGGSNESWEKSWQINTMANVYAARALLPDWIERGAGRMVIVASAAGLLAQVGSGSYTTTKHAAVGFGEYLAIMHKKDGVKVNCVCPQYVKTNLTKGMRVVETGPDRFLEPEDVANALVLAMEKDEFLVLPHEIIGDYFQAKAGDFDRYISGMAKRLDKLDTGHIPKAGRKA